jgi:hypothetical protein
LGRVFGIAYRVIAIDLVKKAGLKCRPTLGMRRAAPGTDVEVLVHGRR